MIGKTIRPQKNFRLMKPLILHYLLNSKMVRHPACSNVVDVSPIISILVTYGNSIIFSKLDSGIQYFLCLLVQKFLPEKLFVIKTRYSVQ